MVLKSPSNNEIDLSVLFLQATLPNLILTNLPSEHCWRSYLFLLTTPNISLTSLLLTSYPYRCYSSISNNNLYAWATWWYIYNIRLSNVGSWKGNIEFRVFCSSLEMIFMTTFFFGQDKNMLKHKKGIKSEYFSTALSVCVYKFHSSKPFYNIETECDSTMATQC